MGQADARLSPRAIHGVLGASNKARQAAYRSLFRSQLDKAAIDDTRFALNQNQSLGRERFTKKIETIPGGRREARSRGRPRLERDEIWAALPVQRTFDG